MKVQLVVVERKTGAKGHAVRKEDGRYLVSCEGHKETKEYSETTFKKYFKLTGDTVKAEETKKVEEPKAEVKKVEVPAPKRNKEDIVETIKKLLALAGNNPSQEEALSATLKAQKLMSKYNVKEEELYEDLTNVNIEIVQTELSGKTSEWRVLLASVVAKNFRCKVFRTGNDIFKFYGYKQDAEVAVQVFTYLYNVCNRLTRKLKRQSRKDSGSAKGIGISFALGFVVGVQTELEKQCTALMIVTPKEVNEGFEELKKSLNMKTKAVKKSAVDPKAYQDGIVEGRNSMKSRQIEAV